MSPAPWRSHLEEALNNNCHLPFSRYFQLATVTSEGYPANRTVVFRGFFRDSDRLKIITDARSEKVQQIQNCQWGEICWYFSDTREQFRLFGQLAIVDEQESDFLLKQERELTWQSLSEAARIQFTWPSPKEKRRQDSTAFFSDVSSEPSVNFYLLLFTPKRVDYLQLQGSPQNRYLYILNSALIWLEKEANP